MYTLMTNMSLHPILIKKIIKVLRIFQLAESKYDFPTKSNYNYKYFHKQQKLNLQTINGVKSSKLVVLLQQQSYQVLSKSPFCFTLCCADRTSPVTRKTKPRG